MGKLFGSKPPLGAPKRETFPNESIPIVPSYASFPRGVEGHAKCFVSRVHLAHILKGPRTHSQFRVRPLFFPHSNQSLEPLPPINVAHL